MDSSTRVMKKEASYAVMATVPEVSLTSCVMSIGLPIESSPVTVQTTLVGAYGEGSKLSGLSPSGSRRMVKGISLLLPLPATFSSTVVGLTGGVALKSVGAKATSPPLVSLILTRCVFSPKFQPAAGPPVMVIWMYSSCSIIVSWKMATGNRSFPSRASSGVYSTISPTTPSLSAGVLLVPSILKSASWVVMWSVLLKPARSVLTLNSMVNLPDGTSLMSISRLRIFSVPSEAYGSAIVVSVSVDANPISPNT